MPRPIALILLPLLCLVAASPPLATIVVTNTNDSGAGSLRQALTDSNTSTGVFDTITFNIPGAGVHTITLLSPLPGILDTVLIDGVSQPGYSGTPLIELDGVSAGTSYGLAVLAGGAGSTIQGLALNRFQLGGAYFNGPLTGGLGGNTIRSCYIGIDPTGTTAKGNVAAGVILNCNSNTVGGSGAGQGNVISGNAGPGVQIIGFDLAFGNTILGNRIGTNAAGTAAVPNQKGILVAGHNTTIGGTTAGSGNLISGNTQEGVLVNATILGTVLQRNLIGTNLSATAALPNGGIGVELLGPTTSVIGATVGGDAATAGNVISGNTLAGLYVGCSSTIQGNRIGTNGAGTAALPNGDRGIEAFFSGTGGSIIGGATPNLANVISGNTGPGLHLSISGDAISTQVLGNFIGTDAGGTLSIPNTQEGLKIEGNHVFANLNTIAFNGTTGILVKSGNANEIRHNSIFSNGGLGILLGAAVFPNDDLDTDPGPNNQQNYPVLQSAVNATGASTLVSWSLSSTPNMQFVLEFYSSPAADASGYGEGKVFQGIGFAFTDTAGISSGATALPAVPLGQVISATVTDSFSNTSPFSPAVPVKADGSVPAVQVTGPSSASSFPTSLDLLPLTGIATDNVGVTGVTWANPFYSLSGPATLGAGTWSATVALGLGDNTIVITATDAAGNSSAVSVHIFLDQTDPTVGIIIPTSAATISSNESPLSVWGTASDDQALTSITWVNSAGGSGTALGTSLWAAAIPLTAGSNVITMTATDTAGNTATATLTVDFTEPSGGTTVVNQTTKKSCGAVGLEVLVVLLLARLRRPRLPGTHFAALTR